MYFLPFPANKSFQEGEQTKQIETFVTREEQSRLSDPFHDVNATAAESLNPGVHVRYLSEIG